MCSKTIQDSPHEGLLARHTSRSKLAFVFMFVMVGVRSVVMWEKKYQFDAFIVSADMHTSYNELHVHV